jgi:nucleoside-diphosphate-sugar epimerase
MANYLVAGAAGFIGSKVCELLLREGNHVVGLDNMEGVYDIRLKQARLARLEKMDQFDFRVLDINEMIPLLNLAQEIQQFDAIINLTATNQQSRVKLSEFIDTKMTGTLNLLEVCKRFDVPKYIHSSSSTIYGTASLVLPIAENISNDHVSQPDAISQRCGESLAYSYHKECGVDVTVFRYFDVYGPLGKPSDLILKLIKSIDEEEKVAIVGDGTQGFGYSYVDDVARGTLQGLKPLGYEVMNLGGHELISFKSLIGMLEKAIGKEAKIEHVADGLSIATMRFPDLGKAKTLLNWAPEVSLQEGIKETTEWYVNNSIGPV